MGVVVGIPLGVLAATQPQPGCPTPRVRVFSLIGYAIPDFYLGALLLIVFALNLGWFPINGGGEGFVDRHVPRLPAGADARLRQGRLHRPAHAHLAARGAAARTTSAPRAPRARARTAVIYRHGLRNALLPLTTGLGLSLLATLSGSVAIELVFNRPGIGKLLIGAIAERDYPVIQGGVVVFAMFVVVDQPADGPRLHRSSIRASG